jgi:AcrR family transcriptional regulator
MNCLFNISSKGDSYDMLTEKKLKQMQKIIDAATEWFMSYGGYFAARMDKIAESAGLTPGALYTYFESKEALFDFVIRKNILNLTPEQWPDTPVPTPPPHSTLEFLKHEVPHTDFLASLTEALESDECPDPKEELERIVREFFDIREKYRIVIIMLYMSSMDWPELNEVWQIASATRSRSLLRRYIEKRISQQLFNPVPDTEYAMAAVEGLVHLFTINRHYLLPSLVFDAAIARDTVIQAVVRFLIPS